MKESQKNSVKNLEYLYSTVVGVGLSLAIYNLIDTTRATVPFRLELMPFFFALLVILIPFYHGALRHLDVTYVEGGGKQLRKFALLFDFLALFVESCIFIILAVLITHPLFFVWGMVGLLVFDSAWGFVAYLGFSPRSESPNYELRWAIINLVAAIVVVMFLILLELTPSNTYVPDIKFKVIIPCMLFLRTVFDYLLCWDFYYPSK